MNKARIEHAAGWTAERVNTLKSMWGEGKSAGEIARHLSGGVTRSAVIGKVHRLKLSARAPITSTPRPPKVRGNRSQPKVQAIVAKVRRSQEMQAMDTSIPLVVAISDHLPDCALISLLDLTEHTCRWPFGEPGRPGFGFCGLHKERDVGPYCPHHAKKAGYVR